MGKAALKQISDYWEVANSSQKWLMYPLTVWISELSPHINNPPKSVIFVMYLKIGETYSVSTRYPTLLCVQRRRNHLMKFWPRVAKRSTLEQIAWAIHHTECEQTLCSAFYRFHLSDKSHDPLVILSFTMSSDWILSQSYHNLMWLMFA